MLRLFRGRLHLIRLPAGLELLRRDADRGRAAWETMNAIAGLSRVLQAEKRCEEAVELLALVADHPFTAYALRQQAVQWLAELGASLDPDAFATHAAAGRTLDLDSTHTALTG